ncbi:MAG: hypothetical protein NVS4B7_02930 [Ktedonobacteraceae bacterium]
MFSSQQKISIHIALEPVCNILNSFALLNEVEHLPGLNTWVVQTAAAFTAEQRRTHRLVFEGLRDALTPTRDEANFPAYLHNLAELNPYLLRQRVLEPLRSRFSSRVSYATPDTKRLLNDVQAYLYCAQFVQGNARFDAEFQAQVHSLLQDPSALQNLLLSHLELLWKTTFVSEWRRVQGSLRWQVEMFTRSLDEEATIEETFQKFTGRQLPPAIPGLLADTAEIILIPAWHNGRHVTTWDGAPFDDSSDWKGKEIVRLFFSEPPNYDVAALHSTPVKRAELRARLSALADETRIRIIELLAQQDEMHAQDIIASLALSQSSVSRHLKQLVSAGYLYERRGEGANKTYRLSSFYFERTADALARLLTGETTQAVQQSQEQDASYAHELKRFVDRHGRLIMWPPARQRDKLLILEHLAKIFEPGRIYSEKEINDQLLLHSTIKDAATLRRALYEFRFMNRTRDGSQYWLIGSEISEQEHPNTH